MRYLVCLLAFLIPVSGFGEDGYRTLVSPLGIDLRYQAVQEAQLAFGIAPVVSKGKLSSRVCYTWPNARVTYSSLKGFGGSFEMESQPTSAAPECVKVNEYGANFPLNAHGIILGMDEAKFMFFVGGAIEEKNGVRVGRYGWTEILTDPHGRGELEAQARIEGTFTEHRLTRLRIICGPAN